MAKTVWYRNMLIENATGNDINLGEIAHTESGRSYTVKEMADEAIRQNRPATFIFILGAIFGFALFLLIMYGMMLFLEFIKEAL